MVESPQGSAFLETGVNFDDSELVQLDTEKKSGFVGSFVWKVVDLLTFGVLEKPPKKSNQFKRHSNNSTNTTENSSETKKIVIIRK